MFLCRFTYITSCLGKAQVPTAPTATAVDSREWRFPSKWPVLGWIFGFWPFGCRKQMVLSTAFAWIKSGIFLKRASLLQKDATKKRQTNETKETKQQPKPLTDAYKWASGQMPTRYITLKATKMAWRLTPLDQKIPKTPKTPTPIQKTPNHGGSTWLDQGNALLSRAVQSKNIRTCKAHKNKWWVPFGSSHARTLWCSNVAGSVCGMILSNRSHEKPEVTSSCLPVISKLKSIASSFYSKQGLVP